MFHSFFALFCELKSPSLRLVKNWLGSSCYTFWDEFNVSYS